METEILPIDEQSLELAAEIIGNHGVVAFPTETVYGLGANGLDGEAVKKIYEIKGRPSDNPLIAHVWEGFDIEKLVKIEQPYVKRLSEEFLPGPLTMVYNSTNAVVKEATCGGSTLAVRIPSHAGARAFLKWLNKPIVAPSANISKHVSPVTAQHVYNDLKGKIPLILDGGRCSVGIESTVLDVTSAVPRILRPGFVTKEQIARVCGGCEIAEHKEGDKVRSPGVKYKHYSPACRTMLFSENQKEDILKAYNICIAEGKTPYVLCGSETGRTLGVENLLDLGNTPEEMAKNLYALLLDGEKKADLIIGVCPENKEGVFLGLVNRLSKACREN